MMADAEVALEQLVMKENHKATVRRLPVSFLKDPNPSNNILKPLLHF